MIPHFPALGFGGVPPVPPNILMSASQCIASCSTKRRLIVTIADPNVQSLKL